MTFTVGDLTVHQIVELVAPFRPVFEMLPDLTPEMLAESREWLRPQDLTPDDHVILSYHSYVVRTPHHTILVDSCLGNDKDRARPEWHRKSDRHFMKGLAGVGLGVEDIDYVMCTHIHADHTGWNTSLIDGRWQPTFPHARYLFSRAEAEATARRHEDSAIPAYVDSVIPLLDAGLADLVDDDFQIGDHMRLLPTPGHTEGHLAIRFGRKRDAIVITGDMLHTPLQTRYPNLSYLRDRDPGLAARTRREFFESYCGTDTIWASGHFPTPSVGRIAGIGDGFRMVG